MRDHIRILGILNIVMGALTATVGLIALIAMGSVAGFIAASLPSITGEDYRGAALAVPLITTIGFVIAIFFFALGLPSIIGGWGLIGGRSWSRILMIVVSVFHLFHIPLGTALGVYGLWVLMSDEAKHLLSPGLMTGVGSGAYPPRAYAQPGPAQPDYRPPSGRPNT